MIIVGLFLEKIALNKTFTVSNNDISDYRNNETIHHFNKAINDFHHKAWNMFKKHVVKSSFNLKREVISSLAFSNINVNTKKVRLQPKDLIEFLKLLNSVRKAHNTNETLNLSDYSVFAALFEENGATKINLELEKLPTITIYIDIRCLLKPQKYIDFFSKELKITEKFKVENTPVAYSRCPRCNIIMPGQFILNLNNTNEKKEHFLFKSFKEKVSSEPLLLLCDIIRDPNFPKDINLNSVNDFMNAIYEVVQKSKDEKGKENAVKVRGFVEEINSKVERGISEEDLFKVLMSRIFKHIKMQFKHVDFISKIWKVLNDITDALNSYSERVKSINEDMEGAIRSIANLDNSIEGELPQALHRKLKLRSYHPEQDELTYLIVKFVYKI
jgi:hypothetical protein